MTDLKAVIVAAGKSDRLGKLTEKLPKCFLSIMAGQPLIQHSLQALKHCGVGQIAFVVGYLKDEFPSRLGNKYEYLFNPFYAITNDMASLWFAKEFVQESDFIYMHSDLLYHPDILHMIISSQAEITLSVEEKVCDTEMMKVRVDNGFNLVESSKDIPLKDAFGEWTGIAKFTSVGWKKYLTEVEELLATGAFNAYDTVAMNQLVEKERVIKISPFRGLPFIEIDYPEDIEEARKKIVPRLRSLYKKLK